MKLIGLDIQTFKDKRVVKFCGVELASFNVISDDYAYTHASDWAQLFETGWERNQMLIMDARVKAASDFAWSNLSDEELFRPAKD